jgi:hypothetical protein
MYDEIDMEGSFSPPAYYVLGAATVKPYRSDYVGINNVIGWDSLFNYHTRSNEIKRLPPDPVCTMAAKNRMVLMKERKIIIIVSSESYARQTGLVLRLDSPPLIH